jgi:hypothetical protein
MFASLLRASALPLCSLPDSSPSLQSTTTSDLTCLKCSCALVTLVLSTPITITISPSDSDWQVFYTYLLPIPLPPVCDTWSTSGHCSPTPIPGLDTTK